MLSSLRIVLKRIMSLCSAVVVLFYCCMKTLQYKKLSFLLLMDIWVASIFFFFMMLYVTICTFLYMSPGDVETFSCICWPFGFRLFRSLVFALKCSMRQFQYHRLFVAVDNQSLRRVESQTQSLSCSLLAENQLVYLTK